MAILDDLCTMLENGGFGKRGTDIWPSRRPADPSRVIALLQYPGQAPMLTHDGNGTDNPMIQVTVRDDEYPNAEALAYEVWNFFLRIANQVVDGVRYIRMVPNSSPTYMTRDSSDRPILGFNVAVMKEIA